MNSYLDGLERYFSFSGRSSRSQYWLFFLVATTLSIIAVWADTKLGEPLDAGLGPIATGTVLFHAIPSLSISIRRLHDIGRSGWWYLVSLIPFGALLLFVWSLCPSDAYANEFGDPAGFGAPAPRRRKSRHAEVEPFYARALRPSAASSRLASGAGIQSGPVERFI